MQALKESETAHSPKYQLNQQTQLELLDNEHKRAMQPITGKQRQNNLVNETRQDSSRDQTVCEGSNIEQEQQSTIRRVNYLAGI